MTGRFGVDDPGLQENPIWFCLLLLLYWFSYFIFCHFWFLQVEETLPFSGIWALSSRKAAWLAGVEHFRVAFQCSEVPLQSGEQAR